MKPRAVPLIGFITAESLSLLGNQIAAIAIPLLVLHYTHSPLATAVAAVGNILPILIAAVVGGRAIDKFGAWNISVLADVLSFCSVLALPIAFLYSDHVSTITIFLLVFAGALFDPTGVSARQTLVPGLAEMASAPLPKVNSWRGALENGADFLGPVLGAALVAAIGAANTFFANAATFLLCAVVFICTVPRRRIAVPEHSSGAALAGVKFIFGHRSLRSLAITGMITSAALLPFLGLILPMLAAQKFDAPALLGISLAAFGLAATAGAAAFSMLSRRYSRRIIYYSGLAITGIGIALCAFANQHYEVVLASALAGLLLGAGNPLQQTVLHEETPESVAGQVFTSLTALQFAGGPIGLMLAGAATELWPVEHVALAAGAVLFASAAAGWWLMPFGEGLSPSLREEGKSTS